MEIGEGEWWIESKAEINQDINVVGLSDTTYKNGYQISLNWNEMYRFLQKQEYPIYQHEFSSSNRRDDVEKDDCEAYSNIRNSRIHHIS